MAAASAKNEGGRGASASDDIISATMPENAGKCLDYIRCMGVDALMLDSQ